MHKEDFKLANFLHKINKGCGSLEGNCCSAPGLPWFHKILNTATTDYIELRVCADQSTSDEDAPVAQYEIYVK